MRVITKQIRTDSPIEIRNSQRDIVPVMIGGEAPVRVEVTLTHQSSARRLLRANTIVLE